MEVAVLNVDGSFATVLGALFVFSIVLPLRLDGVITSSYWAVFTPLWLMFAAIVAGAVGAVVLWRQQRGGVEERLNYIAVLVDAFFFSLVFAFAIMACANASGTSHIDWRAVFVPLFLLAFFAFAYSILVRVYRLRRTYSNYVLSDAWALTFLITLFIALRMAGATSWPWRVVFVPVWLIYAILLPLLLALTGRAVFALFTRRDDAVSRFIWWFWTVACQFILVPSFAFMILLTLNLDGAATRPWTTVFAPLNITLGAALWLSGMRDGGTNPYWLGGLVKHDTVLTRWRHHVGALSYLAPPVPGQDGAEIGAPMRAPRPATRPPAAAAPDGTIAGARDSLDLQLDLGVMVARTPSAAAARNAGMSAPVAVPAASAVAETAAIPPPSPALHAPL